MHEVDRVRNCQRTSNKPEQMQERAAPKASCTLHLSQNALWGAGESRGKGLAARTGECESDTSHPR